MSVNQAFDIKSFQSDVLNDFTALELSFKGSRIDLKGLEKNKELRSHPVLRSIVWIGLSGFRKVGEGAKRNVEGKPDFGEHEAKAMMILSSPRRSSIFARNSEPN